MKKLISFMVFVAAFLITATVNSLHAREMVSLPVPVDAAVRIGPAYPAPGAVWVGGSWGWNRRLHRRMWVQGYWAGPRFYRRPALRMRRW